MPDPDDTPSPAPDDGTARRLKGVRVPPPPLVGSDAQVLDLSRLPGRIVLFVLPRLTPPDAPDPEGWDAVPGALGCAAQVLAYRDHFDELMDAGADGVVGLSAQRPLDLRAAAEGMNLRFPILSDAGLVLARAMRLPVLGAPGPAALRRITLMIEDGAVRHVRHPVDPPAEDPAAVLAWMAGRVLRW